MMKFRFAARAVVFALLLASIPAVSSAQVVAPVVKQLKVFTHKAATINHASLDSTILTLGAANTSDTTYGFGPVALQPGVPDSLQMVVVGIKFGAAIASGESLYTVLQGSADGSTNWTNCNVGSIAIGGSLTGQVANGTVRIASTSSSSTNVAAKSPTGIAAFYGQWGGFPFLRLIFISDKSAAMVANSYSAVVSYPSIVNRGPN